MCLKVTTGRHDATAKTLLPRKSVTILRNICSNSNINIKITTTTNSSIALKSISGLYSIGKKDANAKETTL